jgi:hypothetical protein
VKFGFMVSSSIVARERPGIVGHPHDETGGPRWTPPRNFLSRASAQARQTAPASR